MTKPRTNQDIAWLSTWAAKIAEAHGYKGVIVLGGDGERGKMVVGCCGIRPEQVKVVIADLLDEEPDVQYVQLPENEEPGGGRES